MLHAAETRSSRQRATAAASPTPDAAHAPPRAAPPRNHDVLRRLLAGGGAPFAVNRPGDAYEQEADRRARRALDAPPLPAGGPPSTFSRQSAGLAAGTPLSPGSRRFWEARFGSDLGDVRLHTGGDAARAARSLRARAFTVGSDIAFGDGAFGPDGAASQTLLAHELGHVVAGRAGAAAGPAPGARSTVFRQHEDDDGLEHRTPRVPGFNAPLTVPGAGLTLFPGPLTPTALLGTTLPLPASLRVTNALGAGPGPTFVLDLSPRRLVAHLLDRIDLSVSNAEGTPPDRPASPDNTMRLSLLHPRITLDPATGELHGTATLSVPSGYPLHLRGPTDLDVEIRSSRLGTFAGRIGWGPLHADFSLQLHYDTARLEDALRPAFAPESGFAGFWARLQAILRAAAPGANVEAPAAALQSLLREAMAGRLDAAAFATRAIALVGGAVPAGADLGSLREALTQFAREITHPGFTLRGGLRLGGLPLTSFSATAPTTVPLNRPLLGAPAAFPFSYGAYGVILAPPGSLTTTAVPALGGTYSNFGATSGTSLTTALLPTLSPAAMSAGRPLAEQLPVYAYAEVSHVRRVSRSLDLGLRLTVQIATPELLGSRPAPPATPEDAFRRTLTDYRDATGGTPAPPLPNVGATVFGRFDAL